MTQTNYTFPPLGVRAQCIQVVNGYTVQLLLDLGFEHYKLVTMRLKDVVGTDSQQLFESLNERTRIKELYQWLRDLLKPIMVTDAALLNDWPLRVLVHKVKAAHSPTKDPLGHPEYLVDIWVIDPAHQVGHSGIHEIHVNQQLVELGLAAIHQE